jgi:hypothetical protein
MTSPVIDPGALETLILQVRGVLAGRIVLDDSQEIDEIHVVGSPERNPKQIVRDIESALFVRGGIRVNHRKISLVQLLESSIRPTIERVRLVEIKRSVVEGYDTIAVTLAFGSRTIEGVSQVDGHAPSGGQTQSVSYQEAITESMLGVSIVRKDPLMAVVRAVLDAVNRRLPYLTGQT